MEWGPQGAAAIGAGADYAVVVDILSFTTTLSVALDLGVEVYPYRWRDESAASFARQHDATLAIGRLEAADPAAVAPQVSLSPASMRAATGLTRLVLPSPNGSALSRQLAATAAVVAGACLRNRTAVARWLTRQRRADGQPAVIAVVAAGERWPGNFLRPAVEDLWGAGAVIAALEEHGAIGLSTEADVAAAAFRAIENSLGSGLADCSSGRELASAGFSEDVSLAAELDTSSSVPVLRDGRFVSASGRR
jgi:2-phosphosulfolactate phosphatase